MQLQAPGLCPLVRYSQTAPYCRVIATGIESSLLRRDSPSLKEPFSSARESQLESREEAARMHPFGRRLLNIVTQ